MHEYLMGRHHPLQPAFTTCGWVDLASHQGAEKTLRLRPYLIDL